MAADAGSTPPGADPLEGRSVGDVATAEIVTCGADAPLEEVAWTMSVNRIHAIIVKDEERDQLPVISDSDLIAAAQSGRFHELSAADIAGTEEVGVHVEDSLGRAAQLLAEHGVSHLIVRDHDGTPVGIVSSLDLADAIAGRV